MDLQSLSLPAAAEEPPRQPVPFLAAVVPIAAGVVLWLITGSIFSLCFAALGPLMIGASLLDGIRSRRRARRLAAEREMHAWSAAEQELQRRHRRERREMRRSFPDVASSLREPPLRDLQPVDAGTPVVIGSGDRPSALRVHGDDTERSRDFRERAAAISDAPIAVPMGRGVCLRGPLPVVTAAARALVVQLCLQHAPSQLALSGGALEPLGLAGFPHAGRARRGAWRLAVVIGDEEVPDAAAQIRLRDVDGDVPEGVTTVIDCIDPSRARLRTAAGLEDIAVECLSRPQTVAIAASSVEREGEVAQLPDHVALGDLTPVGDATGLLAVIGQTETASHAVDLVEDGPHAIVTGMTGSGKSELLVTWVTAIAHAHSPEQVAFVLADFKGGTAFDPLRELPHVTAVITDLDDHGARRGVQSLTAELRRRETQLADLGARSITDTAGRMGRLVIVVDEFAALLQEHPDLAVVFTDIAARGRALGMHLILGTQRAAGVIRDALAANCPLRVSLRVADAADSRLVIGTDDAAELSGGAESRGLAFVRRSQDERPIATRIALTGVSDLRAVGARWADAVPPASPWLPSLPHRLPIEQLELQHPEATGSAEDGVLLVGLGDEPEQQRQRPVILHAGRDRGLAIVGGSGSGRSSVLRVLAAQSPDALWVTADPEQAWDAVADLSAGRASPRLVLCDDLDQLVGRLPSEHGMAFVERLETLVRAGAARRMTFALATGRVSGQLARVMDALPTRLILRTGTKLEHLAAGGDNDGYVRGRLPGRARVGDTEVQIAWTDRSPKVALGDEGHRWKPSAELVGVVAPGVRRAVECLRRAHPQSEVAPVGDSAADAHGTQVIVGDAESWQRQWALWQRVRAEGEMLVLAECASELRSLAGCRELPPYAETHRGRAWSIVDGRAPERVIIPEPDPSTAGAHAGADSEH
ncbi:FtsK/SpoIIIE domain-containing protein [Microbacterium sp.]|uniref:FtsK/SpoIIIE domain-containing protein n=1 Tax=Microbacterium sp. TaxID=51671 RepID=UPI002C8FCE16|nr:FtsK/SpoIIIE domain-containing protein [Microbacterium sp.]HWK77365.1 FtsK/SpoIIIE domain-containing protein [Microbacterium sp.]